MAKIYETAEDAWNDELIQKIHEQKHRRTEGIYAVVGGLATSAALIPTIATQKEYKSAYNVIAKIGIGLSALAAVLGIGKIISSSKELENAQKERNKLGPQEIIHRDPREFSTLPPPANGYAPAIPKDASPVVQVADAKIERLQEASLQKTI